MTAAAGVLEDVEITHAYGSTAPYTIGIEEEFQLVHPDTGDLVSRIDAILEQISEDDARNIKPELMQSVIEVATPVCGSLPEARTELGQLRRRVIDLASDNGCRVASAGTHPFARYEFQKITEQQRYTDIISRLKWIARRELIFGLHVHVGMDSPERATAVFNAIRSYLPELLALSANSPFWQGSHTGLMSSRIKVFDAFPRSGIPPRFERWEDWSSLMQRAMKSGAIDDCTYIWWDVRMHPGYGTIEIRICDAQTRLDDSLALAALIQSTCAWLGDAWERGTLPDPVPEMLINENKWSAARYGLDGQFIDFSSDSRISTRDAVLSLIDKVTPFAHELGAAADLAGLDSLLDANGASRQLSRYRESDSLAAVAHMLERDTRIGIPG